MGFLSDITGGSLLGPIGDIFSAKSNERISKRQMDFQERMSSTAHQREVKDLLEAGLNPILSGTGGAGSSSPGGASIPAPNYGTTAVASMRLKQELRNLKATKEKTDAETAFVKSKTGIAEPFKAAGQGIGAIATPISEAFQQMVTELPNTARSMKGKSINWLARVIHSAKQYIEQHKQNRRNQLGIK